MRVAVTGASGFLGRHVMEVLDEAGHEACAYKLAGQYAAFDDYDAVIHCAAACGGIGYNRANGYDLLAKNLRINNTVVSACCDAGVKLVAIGSVCAYPSETPVPFHEEDLWNGYPEPTCAPYGIAKRVLIEQCKQAAKYNKLRVTVLIPTNMYGPGDEYMERSHVIPAVIKKMHDDPERAVVWGDGTPTRDFLYVKDCADACLRALSCDDVGPINLGTGREISIADTVGLIAKETGFAGEISWDITQPNGQMRRRVSISKAADLLGWKPYVQLEQGLIPTVKDYRHRYVPCA